MTCQSAWGVGFPPRSVAFWIEAEPEGDSSSTNRAHDSGHSGLLPVAKDMASMALLSQDMMFWSLETVAGEACPMRPCGVGEKWDQGSEIRV